LEEDLEILGWPRVELRGSVDAPLGHWFARLEDIAPDGTLTTVTGAGLNGAQRESDENPSLLEPGRTYDFNWDMHLVSWVFPKGHRIRVSIRNAWFPVAWPSPYEMTSTVHVGGPQGSRVILPVIPRRADGATRTVPQYLPAELYKVPVKSHQNKPRDDRITRDADGTVVLTSSGSGTLDYGWGKRTHTGEVVCSVNDNQPEAASWVSEIQEDWDLGARKIGWHTYFDLRSDLNYFHYKLRRELFLNGKKIREHSWKESFPRDHH
jgi:hypothetical protein